MWILSMISFAAALWLTNNTIEFFTRREMTSNGMNLLLVAAWTLFAWTQGLFGS